jgi:hypothetical protein
MYGTCQMMPVKHVSQWTAKQPRMQHAPMATAMTAATMMMVRCACVGQPRSGRAESSSRGPLQQRPEHSTALLRPLLARTQTAAASRRAESSVGALTWSAVGSIRLSPARLASAASEECASMAPMLWELSGTVQ